MVEWCKHIFDLGILGLQRLDLGRGLDTHACTQAKVVEKIRKSFCVKAAFVLA